MNKIEFDKISELIEARREKMGPINEAGMVRVFEVLSRSFAGEDGEGTVMITASGETLGLTVVNLDEAETLDMLGLVFTSMHASMMQGAPERELFN